MVRGTFELQTCREKSSVEQEMIEERMPAKTMPVPSTAWRSNANVCVVPMHTKLMLYKIGVEYIRLG